MSYKSNLPVFFRAHNTSKQIAVTGVYNISNYYGCGKGASNNTISTENAYMYGETRTAASSTYTPNHDIKFTNSTTLKSEGLQWWNNSSVSWCPMDDGAYSVTSGDTSLTVAERYLNNNTGTSDAEETRLFGIRLSS